MCFVFVGMFVVVVFIFCCLVIFYEIVVVVMCFDVLFGCKCVLMLLFVVQVVVEFGLLIIRMVWFDDVVMVEIVVLQLDLGVIVVYGGLVCGFLFFVFVFGWINLYFLLLLVW